LVLQLYILLQRVSFFCAIFWICSFIDRTISYRLEKIKQISGINFDNANEVLAVSNGLIIYKMLKEIE